MIDLMREDSRYKYDIVCLLLTVSMIDMYKANERKEWKYDYVLIEAYLFSMLCIEFVIFPINGFIKSFNIDSIRESNFIWYWKYWNEWFKRIVGMSDHIWHFSTCTVTSRVKINLYFQLTIGVHTIL